MTRALLLGAILSCAARATAAPRYESKVTGDEAQRLRESAEAVTVTSTESAQPQSADLGTVIDRVQGIRVQRQGGLGTEARLSLNGLSGDQVRLYLDGVPLEIAGFAFGFSAIPVALVERIEVYRGVVPLRFGADALGGAINLVSSARTYGAGASGALQLGSFGTLRASASAHGRDARTGLYGAVTGYADATKNDYDVDVQVSDPRGRLVDVSVPRFHDRYAARGVVADFGVVDRPWARRLVLRFHYSDYDKALQSNPIMTVPYGGVRYGEQLVGGTLTFAQAIGRGVELDALVGVSHRATDFRDLSPSVFDWYGRPVFQRPQPGELDGVPHDVTLWRDTVYGRVGLAARVARDHVLRISTTVQYDASHGLTRVGLSPGSPDPLAGARNLLKLVSGLEHTATLLGGRIENIVFLKHYHLHARAALLVSGASLQPVALDDDTAGAGEALRVRLYRDELWLEASYEYATRMPAPMEIFGDGVLLLPSATLRPERSHNANLTLAFDVRRGRTGAWAGSLDLFARGTSDLITLLASANGYTYRNVYAARALGIQGSLRWRAPGEWVVVEATATMQDVRNVATEGAFASLRGDRLPNTPWLFAHAALRVQHRRLFRRHDELSLTWMTRYVHAFYRDWESLGAPAYKPTVDAQLAHSVSLVYLLRLAAVTTFAIDLENLTDQRLYDVYGVQRPGRAAYGKVTVAF